MAVRRGRAKKKQQMPAGIAPGRGGSPPGSRGQPPFIPTEAQRMAVMGLVSIGTERWAIAQALNVPERTLFRHFTDELERGKGIIHARIGGGLVASALSGNLTAMIFFAKAQMGWRDRAAVSFEDAHGNPGASLFSINITGLNDADRGTVG
jgi:hypothetical protein